ncbi:hypothetical protein ACQEU3_02100 [Spirillospora sp. CA-253888]
MTLATYLDGAVFAIRGGRAGRWGRVARGALSWDGTVAGPEGLEAREGGVQEATAGGDGLLVVVLPAELRHGPPGALGVFGARHVCAPVVFPARSGPWRRVAEPTGRDRGDLS